MTNFYLSTWEEYHTGTLFLSVISGPVEGILLVVGIDFLIAAKGPGIFHHNIIERLGLIDYVESLDFEIPAYVTNMTIIDFYMIIAGVGLLFNILSATGNVITSCHKQNKSIHTAISGTFSYLFFYATLTAWAIISPILLQSYLILPFSLATGAVVALSVGRIITAHVTDSAFPPVSAPMLIPTFAIITNLVAYQWHWDLDVTNTALVWIALGSSVATYGFFVGELIAEITTYLDIGCLYIKYPKVTAETKQK